MSDDEKQQIRNYALLAIVAFVGGGGGSALTASLAPNELYRPDPFTGVQGAALDRRLEVVEFHNRQIEERLDIITERLISIEPLRLEDRGLVLDVRLRFLVEVGQRSL